MTEEHGKNMIGTWTGGVLKEYREERTRNRERRLKSHNFYELKILIDLGGNFIRFWDSLQ